MANAGLYTRIGTPACPKRGTLEHRPRRSRALRLEWQQEARVVPGSIDVEALAHSPFREDASVANGSSIAFLAEIEVARCLSVATPAHTCW